MKSKERPAKWWKSSPRIVNGKFLCIAIDDKTGEETVNLFSIEELINRLEREIEVLTNGN